MPLREFTVVQVEMAQAARTDTNNAGTGPV
jgi:hypothetical protein